VFWKKRVVERGFCWCDRGRMRGKRGVLTAAFPTLKNTPRISTIFSLPGFAG
jgi:hypothetical protein